MIYTKQKILSKAKQHNIKVEDDGGVVWVDAPKGFVFTDTDLHWVHVPYYDDRYTKAEVWKMIWLDIKDGVEKCIDETCDSCLEGVVK